MATYKYRYHSLVLNFFFQMCAYFKNVHRAIENKKKEAETKSTENQYAHFRYDIAS